jgi:P27 family predicted phage terminase small subunit
MAGRPPKPTQVKKNQGTLKKCRSNKNEPKYPALEKMPPPPKELNKYGMVIWDLGGVLISSGVLTTADLDNYTDFCFTYQRYRELRSHIEKNLLVNIANEHGGRSAAALQMSADEKRVKEYTNEYGLNPASRGKLGVGNKKDDDPKIKKMQELLGA